jgi:hypothetical protein
MIPSHEPLILVSFMSYAILTRATGNEGYNGRVAKIQPLTTPNNLQFIRKVVFNGSWEGIILHKRKRHQLYRKYIE